MVIIFKNTLIYSTLSKFKIQYTEYVYIGHLVLGKLERKTGPVKKQKQKTFV